MQFRKENVRNKPEWMQCPDVETDYPGLAYVGPLDEIIVTEATDELHRVIGGSPINYTILNSRGQKVFVAVRHEKYRKFTVKVFNNYGNEVIEVKKPFKLCANRVLVWAPPGVFAGSVEQKWNTYLVKNENGDTVLILRAQGRLRMVYSIRYVYGVDAIGRIRKETPVDGVEDVKNIGLTFPVQLDVRDKAVLIGACFLIGR